MSPGGEGQSTYRDNDTDRNGAPNQGGSEGGMKLRVQNSIQWNEFLEGEVYPRLSAAMVFTHAAHAFQKTNAKWRGGCPWHASQSGSSFSVNPVSLQWRCAGCDVGGHVLQYLDRLDGGNGCVRGQRFFDLVHRLCEIVGVAFPRVEMSDEEKAKAQRLETRRQILEAAITFCQQQLWLPDAKAALAYLHSRGFTDDNLKELEVGLYTDTAQLKEHLLQTGFDGKAIADTSVLWTKAHGYATFPWRDEVGRMLTLYGQITPVVATGKPKKLAWPNPKVNGKDIEHTKRSPYCLHHALAARHNQVTVVEGLTDAALLQAKGQTDVVGIVAGLISDDQIRTLKRRQIKSVVIALDPDAAGDNNLNSNVVRLAQAGLCPYVAPRLPEGVDPDEFVLQRGVEAWKKHVGGKVHGFRWAASRLVEKHGRTESDEQKDRLRNEALAWAAPFAAGHAAELLSYFLPPLAGRLGLPAEALMAEARRLGNRGQGERSDTGAAGEGASPIAAQPPWPTPLAPQAYHGLAGAFVRLVLPHTEADPAALLLQTLVSFGSLIGRTAHFRVEGDQHWCNEFVAVVGKTANARKGTSWGQVRRFVQDVDPDWSKKCQATGLASGEGIKWHIRDPIFRKHKGEDGGYEEEMVDEGVSDKRLLVVEPEFASVLKAVERQGCTLSAIIRLGWDGVTLKNLTKHDPLTVSDPHISVIAHITTEEARRCLSGIEAANGFGNRFLWVCSQRSKLLPEGGSVPFDDLVRLKGELARVVVLARQLNDVQRDDETRKLWHAVYPLLSADRRGLAGGLLARAEAHVLRLSMLYAAFDASAVIRKEHLLAALAIWDYVEQSVRHIFGDSVGDEVADEILRLLREHPKGMKRWDVSNYFGRNLSAERLGKALALLAKQGLARHERSNSGGGRPAEIWIALG